MICNIEGCGGKHYGKGLCNKHWQEERRSETRKWKQGECLQFIQNLIITSKIKQVKECIIPPCYKDKDGYGSLFYNGALWKVHRLSLFLFTGNNPTNKYCCHGECHNPSCVNPFHLKWASPKENCQDRKRDGTYGEGEKHSRSKLTSEQVLIIRQRLLYGDIIKNIAVDMGVHSATISDIKHGRTWSKIKI